MQNRLANDIKSGNVQCMKFRGCVFKKELYFLMAFWLRTWWWKYRRWHESSISLFKSCIMQIPAKVIEFPGIVYIKPKPGNKNSLTHKQVFFNVFFLGCNVENILEKSGFRTLGKLVKFTLKKKEKIIQFLSHEQKLSPKNHCRQHHNSWELNFNNPFHHYWFFFGFFSPPILWGRLAADHLQEGLSKFGYRSDP